METMEGEGEEMVTHSPANLTDWQGGRTLQNAHGVVEDC